MVIQIASGVILTFFYVRGALAWDSVVLITREVRRGWLVRSVHRNFASFVFIVLYLHIIRGLINASFSLKLTWISGWIIIVLAIAAAFLGYVLPWGQISFWGATVIINLISILPKGKLLVVWLWGGFYVSIFTCRFFFGLHYLVPMLIIVIILVHLFFLHFRGRTVPAGVGESKGLSIKFMHLFLIKDAVNMAIVILIWLAMLAFPDWAADAENFSYADMSNSPLHIQPEWYFLHLYAILRSIPNKVGGLIAFVAALFILLGLTLVFRVIRLKQFSRFRFLIVFFISINIILIWLGMQPVEEPYVFVGQIRRVLYFSAIFLILALDKLINLAFWG